MCGIAGIIQPGTKQFSPEHLKKMMASLSHRGPDGEGLWQNTDGTVLLGHRRLSIIDLSPAGHQPMSFLNRYNTIHNGEIYNYIELKKELERKGYSFHSHTDTEVIAAAYDCWKENCLQHFDGMFAFAIWDNREQELFAARDRFGEKPFFYVQNGNQFLFASEMKALWAAGIPKEPNLKMLFNFITIGYTDNPEKPGETFFENIAKLPAATYLKYSLIYSQFTLTRYWNIDPDKENSTIKDVEAVEQFSDLFSDAVRKRLRSDVTVGTSLSGGLDSSAVAATSSRFIEKGQPFACFTAAFPGFEKDELTYARQVAESFKLQHHSVNIHAEEMLSNWEKLCYHQEEPFGSAGIYAQYKVYELAKQHSTTVLLDGQGADEILAGYHKYYKWYWQELFRKRKLKKSGELNAARELGIGEPFNYKNKIASWFPSYASIVMEKHYLLKAIRHEDLTKEFVQQQSKEAYYTPPDLFTLNGVLHFNSFMHGLEELLRYADRNSMAHGREVRLPFLSHQLVEFLFSLPAKFKIRNGWTKWLLRQCMSTTLPAEIVWRRDKVGFEAPQKKWMENKQVQEAIYNAKEKLVLEKILKEDAMKKSVTPLPSYEADNFDWRYFSSAILFK